MRMSGGGEVPGAVRRLEVRLLGELQVRRANGTWIRSGAFGTVKTRHVLRLLALRPGVAYPVEPLLESLWPDVTPARARASLRTAASHLRRTLGCPEAIVRVGDALMLEHVDVDVVRFASGADVAARCFARGRLARGLVHARVALGHYRGDLAADEPYLEPLLDAQAHARHQLRELLVESSSAALTLGRWTLAAELAHRTTEVDPLCERAYRTAMWAFVQLDEPAMALRLYERCRRVVVDELGTRPAPTTEDLYLRILSTPRDVTSPEFAAPPVPPAPWTPGPTVAPGSALAVS